MLKQSGFNMIELVIAMAVVAIAATIAIPAFGNMIGNAQTRTIAESFSRGLQIARLEAVKRNKPVKFSIDEANNHAWQVGCVTATAKCPAVITSSDKKEQSNANINIALTGASEATFTSLGTLSATAGQLSRINVTNTSVDSAYAKKLSVLLGVGGDARMCDQDVTDPNDPRKC